ncbi:uncharacterized protein LOC109790506 [Cajanus cajan]|uniref:uncharacterized protein LOC109790506 n=1 Tax=Cajanus cajan TaxID=3821 RepID=UPI00098DD04D|nr:uncharacterized protein LOC109790506 [Cajanus cajan]
MGPALSANLGMKQERETNLPARGESLSTSAVTTARQTRTSTLTSTLHRAFPTSLKGAALNWYTQLLAESIDNFGTLVRRFTVQYATSRPHHVTSAALASLRQGYDEPLRTFMERFAGISVKIQNLNPKVTLHAMLMALKSGPFVDSLCREAPRDMDELRARAAGYIQMEEHSAFRD